jgi:hypothetical protein
MKVALFAVALLLSACKPSPEAPVAPAAPTAPEAPAAATTDVVTEPSAEPAPPQALAPAASGWVGKWIGPEGTFLELSETDGAYKLTIQSLDGTATFDAVAVEDRVEFQRNGTTETIRATSGAETGMKWLLDKKDCLTIKTGEGFCRD